MEIILWGFIALCALVVLGVIATPIISLWSTIEEIRMYRTGKRSADAQLEWTRRIQETR